jgi:hypothetical protein
LKNFWLIFVAALGFSVWFGGCQGTKPMSPTRVISLKVSIPRTNELRSSLLGAGSNELMYKVEGPGMSPMAATLGPFATASSSGTIDFSLNIPGGGKRLVSLQLNDGGTHQPLAIGAAEFDFSSAAPVTDFVVELGSVARNCYDLSAFAYYASTAYGFNSNQLFIYGTYGTNYDIAMSPLGGGYQIVDAQGNTAPYNANSIAFLGNGDFVDHDVVPPDSAFYSQSAVAKAADGAPVTVLEAGDIYCVKVATIPGAHAWIRVKTPGAGMTTPTVHFRVNDSKPYFAYYQTPPDATGTPCPAQ